MKYLNRLLVLSTLLLPMSVWAQATKHLNLYYKSKQLYVGLYNEKCNVDKPFKDGTCLKSDEISSTQSVHSAFYKAVYKDNGDEFQHWVSDAPDATKMQSTVLNLATDIDFGQTLGTDGTCSENHSFFPFSGATFNGQNKTISNLCRVEKGEMKQYFGLFGEMVDKTVKNLKISNVHFAVADEYANGDPASTSGGDYRAAGALASTIYNSTVMNVELKDVVVQAPLAGGLAGYIEGSTIKGITTTAGSFIQVSNECKIESGFIGSTVYKNGEYAVIFNPYKVILGGVAGAAFFSNFQDVDIAVQIKNEAAVDLSALGGLVGHYVYAPKVGSFPQTNKRNSTITNVKIHGIDGSDYTRPVVSGGTAMGGILGATRRLDENNSPIVELAVSNSSVTSLDIKQSKIKVNSANVNQNLYFGGVVGNADLCSGGILKVTESTVDNINIEESVRDDATFQYYMGGIAGYASCSHKNNSGNRDDLYLTLQNSTASGSINLEGGYSPTGKASSSVRVSAVMGGLVGDAIVSLDEGGISDNESKVSIAYKAKRAKNDDDLDSVLVGGLFGGVSISNSPINFVRLTKLSYEGSIDIEDDGIIARVGGIVGRYPFISRDDAQIEFHDVHVKAKGNNIVSYSGENKSSNTSSSIGGICGMCQSPKLISRSSVEGSFKGTAEIDAPPEKEFYVGGLVGISVVKVPMVVKNNYYVGTIDDKFNKLNVQKEKEEDLNDIKGFAGYLFGYLTGDGLGTQPQITSNYHFGSDNLGAIGLFRNYGFIQNSIYLNELSKFNAQNNVRNGATENLNENGNGYVTESYMKTKDFAVFLNGPWSEDEAEDQVWSWSSGKNGDYPFFGDSPVLTYTVRFLDGNSHELASGEVSYGGSAESLAPEKSKIPVPAGTCFSGWSQSIDKVFKSMDVYPLYEAGVCKYEVTFNGLDGKPLENVVAEDGTPLKNPQKVEEGKAAILPKGPARVGNNCFLKWDDEDANNDFTNVTHNIVVSAISKECYDVTFYDMDGNSLKNAKTKDGKDLENPQVVDKGSPATAPKDPEPTADGKCFSGWSVDFSNVTKKLSVEAKWKTCEYTVKFYDLRGFVIEGSEQKVLYGEAAVVPADPPSKDDLCFIGWDTDFSVVKGNLEVKPNTKKCVFTVNFYGLDGTTVIKTQNVQEGLPASAPDSPEPLGDLCFDGWNTDFSEVKGDLEVKADTKACPNSSSSDQQSSSSSAISSSSSSSSNVNSSSSRVNEGSSSSNEKSMSSSSENFIYTIAKPTATQNDNALRMTINDTLAGKHANVDYRIVVETKNMVYLDTVVKGKDVENIKNGTWTLSPAPAGDYYVYFTLTDGNNFVNSDTMHFEGKTTQSVNLAPNSWQTYSLYAFCYNKDASCKSELEERFAHIERNHAIEECRHMKAELAQNPDDEYFREFVEEVCREASEAQSDLATSVFWWDELNPVGDYWQYRKFDAEDKLDSTRGYWYGTINEEPLEFSLQTPHMDDEIVWKLENKYSGWNLVANPYGWSVKLPQSDALDFVKWDPEGSEYVPANTLGPYEAIWVKTDKSREFRIPLKASIVLEGENEKKSLSKSSASENWNLRVVLSDDKGKRDSWNVIAAGSVESSMSEPPAGMGDRVNLSIVEGKQRLAKSVKKNSDDLEWNFVASATSYRKGHLSFEGLESVRARGLHVYATVDGETVEVVNNKSLDMAISSKSKNVSVRVTKSAVRAQVAKNLISGFRVNQMSNALNIGFDAASKLAGANVKVSVVGVDGRVVATSGAVAKEGTNAISMKKPKQGVYFVRVKVGSQTATNRILVH